MTPADVAYLTDALRAGLIEGPCLELGASLPEHSAQTLLRDHSIDYRSTDIEGDVDYRVDFEAPDVASIVGEHFATVLVMNVLEHCFDPIRVLDNACRLVRRGGRCLVITPAIWPLHGYPIDCWRLLPDFYREYAKRRELRLPAQWFRYIDDTGSKATPEATLPAPGRNQAHRLYSRAIHKMLRTTGRGTWTRHHVAIGAILEKP